MAFHFFKRSMGDLQPISVGVTAFTDGACWHISQQYFVIIFHFEGHCDPGPVLGLPKNYRK